MEPELGMDVQTNRALEVNMKDILSTVIFLKILELAILVFAPYYVGTWLDKKIGGKASIKIVRWIFGFLAIICACAILLLLYMAFHDALPAIWHQNIKWAQLLNQ